MEQNNDANVAQDTNEPRVDWITPEIESAIAFDPFLTPEDEGLAADAVSADPAAADAVPKPDDQTGAQAIPQADPQPASVSPDVVALQQEVSRLTSLMTQQAQPAPAAPTTPQPDIYSEVPPYEFQIPDQLVQMMGSENPQERQQAINLTMKGVAQGVHSTVMGIMKQQLSTLTQQIPAAVTAIIQEENIKRNVATDFYTKYPNLNRPELYPIVAQMAQKHFQQTGRVEWNEATRDAVAGAVITLLGGVVPAAPPAAPAQNTPAMFGGNAASGNPRLHSPNGAMSQADQITDLFS